MTDQVACEKVFAEDEMCLRTIDPSWTQEDLLGMDGIFYLKDVVGKLEISTADCKKLASDLELNGLSPWETMGLRKSWSHWIVRMSKFAEFIKWNTLPTIRHIDPNWDGNTLLAQSGLFYLTDVCEKIPFSAHQIRFQARQNKAARTEYGVWKDPGYATYVVSMEVFSKWIQSIWCVALAD